MRIALVHPTYWPEVRRGSERLIKGLAGYLSRRGFEVTVLTGHRARREVTVDDGIRVVRSWRPPARLQPASFEPYANHALIALKDLLLGRFDLVHAFHMPDARAAATWSRLTGKPLVVTITGFPDRRSLGAFRERERMLRGANRRAASLNVLSHAARQALADSNGLEATVLPPGIDVDAFAVETTRSPQPTILCAATPGDPRKRVENLVAAFALVREQIPKARLQITFGHGVGARPDHLRAPEVELIDPRSPAGKGLAHAYASAWVSVLPSEREAFGQVLVESLAAGTPAVGMHDGGAAEILDDPRIGVVCADRDPDTLADAVVRGMRLANDPGIATACRAHARRWDWDRIGLQYEARYAAALRR